MRTAASAHERSRSGGGDGCARASATALCANSSAVSAPGPAAATAPTSRSIEARKGNGGGGATSIVGGRTFGGKLGGVGGSALAVGLPPPPGRRPTSCVTMAGPRWKRPSSTRRATSSHRTISSTPWKSATSSAAPTSNAASGPVRLHILPCSAVPSDACAGAKHSMTKRPPGRSAVAHARWSRRRGSAGSAQKIESTTSQRASAAPPNGS